MALIVGLSVAGGVAWSVIPSSVNGQITACYPTSGPTKGQLRVIDAQAGQTCGAGNATVAWQKNGLRWRGAWNGTTAYAVNDLVTFGRTGQAFVAAVASTGKRPADGGFWRALASGTTMTPTQIGSQAWWRDPARPAALSTFQGPTGLAFDGTNIWMANNNTGELARLDTNTAQIIDHINLAVGIYGVAFDGTSLWVTNFNTGKLSKINPNTRTVIATVTVGGSPTDAIFDGTYLWVADDNHSVVKVNPTTNAVIATISLGPAGISPSAVTFDGTSIWVANTAANSLSKINPTTNAVSDEVTGLNAPSGVAFDGTYIWANNSGNHTLSKIEPGNALVVATVPIGGTIAGNCGIIFDGTYIWALEDTSVTGWAVKVDPVANTVLATVAVGNTAVKAAFDGRNIWVSSGLGGTVLKMRP